MKWSDFGRSSTVYWILTESQGQCDVEQVTQAPGPQVHFYQQGEDSNVYIIAILKSKWTGFETRDSCV